MPQSKKTKNIYELRKKQRLAENSKSDYIRKPPRLSQDGNKGSHEETIK